MKLYRSNILIKQWLTFFDNIADAVKHIHNQGVLHNDIKLDNIILGEQQNSNVATLSHVAGHSTVNHSLHL
jgi:serine/threonine protein kinase